MNAPFDPDETHNGPESEDQDPFGENSMTWGAADPDFDSLLRDRLGPLPNMPTPPYAFERVLLAGRRRRSRKVWAAGAAAALVVMAGTAGTTVALRGPSPTGVVGPAAGTTQHSTVSNLPSASPSSAKPSPSPTTATPSQSTTTSVSPSAATSTTASTEQCHSDDLQLTVQVSAGGDSLLVLLQNNSAHSCTTYGYPGLQTETVNEQLQSTTVTRVDRSTVAHLTVGPGQFISTLATFTPAAAGSTAAASPAAGCGAPSYYLAVIPPNEQSQIAATIQGGPVTICGSGVLNTGPLVMGKTGGQ